MKAALKISFILVAGLLVAALLFTIIGSATNNNAVLMMGIIAWLAGSGLFFAWLILWISARTKRYAG